MRSVISTLMIILLACALGGCGTMKSQPASAQGTAMAGEQVKEIMPGMLEGYLSKEEQLDSKEFEQNRYDVVTRLIERGINYIDACTMQGIGARVVAAGLATAADVERITAALARAAADPEVLMSMPRIVQAWGRKP